MKKQKVGKDINGRIFSDGLPTSSTNLKKQKDFEKSVNGRI